MTTSKPSLKDTLHGGHEATHADHAQAELHGRHHAFHHKVKTHVLRHVHRLRQKPDHHKRIIAFGTAFSITAVIFVCWYYFSLPRIMSMYETNVEENKRLNRNPNIIQGFNNLQDAKKNKANISDGIEVEE